ncbi:MAG TPA: DUF3102 domain-containing protein [Ktedonobacteraceae bacterium]|nr:DUF3102 domain-containing protein [Ktedonobacteraceae bacterium]
MEDEAIRVHVEDEGSTLAPFDYTLIEESKRAHIQMKAEDVKVRMKRTAEDIIAIGLDLLEVKHELGHGLFQKWLKAEFDLSESAATKFMQVASRFGGEVDKSVKITSLPATVLYTLAAPSTPDEVVQRVLAGEIPADAKAIRDAKEAQRKAEEELARERRERSVVEARVLNINYEQQVLREALQEVKEERDYLKRELEGGLEAYYAKHLQLKADNTFLGLIMHGMQKLAEIQQYMLHVTSTDMLPEVRRLGEGHEFRFRAFVAQLRQTYQTLYEADIKLTGPLKEESTIVDEGARPKEGE